MSHFGFLQSEWPALFEAALKAESLVHPDPRTACFYARRTLELAVDWLYRNDGTLHLPYHDHLSALIYEPTFQALLGPALHAKTKLIKDLGNLAVHSQKTVSPLDSLTAVRELFHLCYWLARTYARTPAGRPEAGATFQAANLPATSPVPPQTAAQLQKLAEELAERDAKLVEMGSAQAVLTEELERLRAEVAAAKARNAAEADTHDYSEAETRDYFIDLLLKEAGWALDEPRDREVEVRGMPNESGTGYVDYVLWGNDGKPLGLVEAKRTKRDPVEGQHQAKLYADCLEAAYGQRPVIFYSNGYEHWIWDDSFYPPRPIQGFLKRDELELAVQRRQTRMRLGETGIDLEIAGRHYQTRAIRRIAESFEQDHQRRALLVMATGSGKTRTVIALCDLLMRCNWAKRILFLADRVALVNQAVGAFKKHLPASAPVNLCTEKTAQGRVYIATYPTMMNLIDEASNGQRRFGPGHFDVVIIDEAHRSVYQRYGAIFDYFDSFLVGLTATPKDEVDHNTYRLFHLETGVPTDVYGLEEAVKDGFLVPPRSVSVPLRFQREGIRYADLTEEEKDQWDAVEWDEDGQTPDRVEAEAVNRWLFNADTVDKVLEHLMTHGQMVNGGEIPGKTIIFAKNQDHAEFIQQRFDINYPHWAGALARVITFKTEYAQSLIDDFSSPNKFPQIAISVDMLDTGIDVPDVVNLVFFKLVRSKTKFWQMLGRGTRLRPDLFGPGKHKEFFYLFDYCQNLEFFSQDPEVSEGSSAESLSKRLFTARLELISALDKRKRDGNCAQGRNDETGLREETAELLRQEVAAMPLDNFIVRPQRRFVETYAKAEAWQELNVEAHADLAAHVAGLPTGIQDSDIDAKRFDLLMLRLQLALLNAEPAYARLKQTVQEIASALCEKESIPMVHERMELILDLVTETWWEGVTAPLSESVRKRLRALVKLIEAAKRPPVYTDFEDEIGRESEIELPGVSEAHFERFREKARAFLREHEEEPSIHRLRYNERLSQADLERLEQILLGADVATAEDLHRAKDRSEGFIPFLRSLAGLNREAAKQRFAQFTDGRTLSAKQLEFINLIIDHLAESGPIDPARLYESPFTDIHAQGPEGLFPGPQTDQLIGILTSLRTEAAA